MGFFDVVNVYGLLFAVILAVPHVVYARTHNYDLKVIIPLGKETTEIKDFITTIDNNGSINNYEKTKEGYTLFSLLCDIVYKLDILYVIFVFVFIF